MLLLSMLFLNTSVEQFSIEALTLLFCFYAILGSSFRVSRLIMNLILNIYMF